MTRQPTVCLQCLVLTPIAGLQHLAELVASIAHAGLLRLCSHTLQTDRQTLLNK